MKTILLVRHAKSDWGDPSLDDFDRPLNERGKRDAPSMADRLIDKKIKIDSFIASPAKRAKKTACIFAKAYGQGKDDINFHPELYGAAEDVFFDVISKAHKKADVIAVFSHNPGITEFANLHTDVKVDNIPTCGIFAFTAECDSWKDFRNAKKNFLFFDYPKNLIK